MNVKLKERLEVWMKQLHLPSPLEKLNWGETAVWVKRDDLIHPVISGNKWRKIKSHAISFLALEKEGIISMGGPHSNHLHALGYFCFTMQIPLIAKIYGWNGMFSTSTIQDLLSWNVRCESITRQEAHDMRARDSQEMVIENKPYYWIPEGGGGELGALAWDEWVQEMPEGWDHSENLLVVPCGTGTTIQGILDHTHNVHLCTLRAVRSAQYAWEQNPRVHWLKPIDYPSFAKPGSPLLHWMNQMAESSNMLLDPVYNGPLWYAFQHAGMRNKYQKVFLLHTGGLQGLRSQKFEH